MARLYVLEGEAFNGTSKYVHRKNRQHKRERRVPGITTGTIDYNFMGGRSLWKKAKSIGKGVVKIAAMPVTMAYTATKSVAKATTHAVLNPSMKNFSRIVTDPAKRITNETKQDVRTVAHVAAESARATNTAASRTGKAVVNSANVIRRVAKRLIKGLARKVLFSGDDLMGASVGRVPANAAKAMLMPTATALVLANSVTAPAAPIVPVLVNEVVDELYSAISRGIEKGLSPKKAEEAALEQIETKTPEEENDPSPGVSPLMIAGLAALAIGAFVFLKRRKK
jgi:LPXTG-motif cell wall-anchored protein